MTTETSRAQAFLTSLAFFVFALLFSYHFAFLRANETFTYTFLYPYNLPAVLFTTLGLIALYRKQWTLYYVLFAFATLNRETSYFLAFVYLAVSFGQEKPSSTLRHLTAQTSRPLPALSPQPRPGSGTV